MWIPFFCFCISYRARLIILYYILCYLCLSIFPRVNLFFFFYLFDELLIIYFGTQFHCLLNNFVIFFTPYKEISNLKWFLDTNVDIRHYINLRFLSIWMMMRKKTLVLCVFYAVSLEYDVNFLCPNNNSWMSICQSWLPKVEEQTFNQVISITKLASK